MTAAPRLDLLLGSDIGLWVLSQVGPAEVGRVITHDPAIAEAALQRGFVVDTSLSVGWRALSVHYPRILTARQLACYSAVYNLHPGYLPWGRGHFPLVWAIWLGEPAGATLHRMVRRVDAGPIVAQMRVAIRATDTAFSVHRRIRQAERRLFGIWWPRLTMTDTPPEREQGPGGSFHTRDQFTALMAIPTGTLGDTERERLTRALTFPGRPGIGSGVPVPSMDKRD